MKKYFANPFFYSSLAAVVILGLIISSYALGWTTPTQSPPGGNVVLSPSQWTTNGTSIYYNTGNVGIGTTTPPYRFTIELPDDGTLNKILFRGLRSTAGGSPVNIQLSGPNSPATASKKNFGINFKNAISGKDYNVLQFSQYSDDFSSSYPLLTLSHGGSSAGGVIIGGTYGTGAYSAPSSGLIVEGNVGIGTTTPGARLEVAGGDIKVSGNIYRNYTDYTPGGSGLVWIKIAYNNQNYGDLPIHLIVTRSISWNSSTPYGGPTLDLKCHGKEWHSGQQFCTAQYGYHGDSGAEITHVAIRDLSSNGYYIFLRLNGGVTYRFWQMADSGTIYTISDDSGSLNPGTNAAYALTTGYNIIGDTTPNLYVAGNVGIGTAAPSYKLDVSGDVRLTGNLIATANTLDSCAWTAYTCNANQTCPTGQVMTGVERYTSGSLCGTAPTRWYQMRLYCCYL